MSLIIPVRKIVLATTMTLGMLLCCDSASPLEKRVGLHVETRVRRDVGRRVATLVERINDQEGGAPSRKRPLDEYCTAHQYYFLKPKEYTIPLPEEDGVPDTYK